MVAFDKILMMVSKLFSHRLLDEQLSIKVKEEQSSNSTDLILSISTEINKGQGANIVTSDL